MADLTQRQIIERLEALDTEAGAAYRAERARIDKERASLRELCGGLGHVFARNRDFVIMGGQSPRKCVFCGEFEPITPVFPDQPTPGVQA